MPPHALFCAEKSFFRDFVLVDLVKGLGKSVSLNVIGDSIGGTLIILLPSMITELHYLFTGKETIGLIMLQLELDTKLDYQLGMRQNKPDVLSF